MKRLKLVPLISTISYPQGCVWSSVLNTSHWFRSEAQPRIWTNDKCWKRYSKHRLEDKKWLFILVKYSCCRGNLTSCFYKRKPKFMQSWKYRGVCIQSNIMAKRFGDSLSEQESSKRLRNAIPDTTQYKIQWGMRIFGSWKAMTKRQASRECPWAWRVNRGKFEDRNAVHGCWNVEFLVV